MNILILPDSYKAENPCEKCESETQPDCAKCCDDPAIYQAKQSILSLCVDVDLDEMLDKYFETEIEDGFKNKEHWHFLAERPFSQFIQQEVKDGNSLL